MLVVIYAKTYITVSFGQFTKTLNHSFDLSSAKENLETCIQIWFK